MKFLQLSPQLFVRIDAITHILFLPAAQENPQGGERAVLYLGLQNGHAAQAGGSTPVAINIEDQNAVQVLRDFLASNA